MQRIAHIIAAVKARLTPSTDSIVADLTKAQQRLEAHAEKQFTAMDAKRATVAALETEMDQHRSEAARALRVSGKLRDLTI